VDPPVAPAPVPKDSTPLTPEGLNSALVEEYKRLGSRDGIMSEMAKMNATSVNDLKPEQYQDLLDAVRKLGA
jgi:hypothetical protein